MLILLMIFFGNTIIKCAIWQLNQSAAASKQLSPGLADTYEVKKSAYSSSVHKTCGFYNVCFSIEQKMGIMKPRVQTKLMGSSSTKIQGLLLLLSPLIFTNFCTCWLRFYRSITLWHFTRNSTSPLNSHQCPRSLLRLAIGVSYQHIWNLRIIYLVKKISYF